MKTYNDFINDYLEELEEDELLNLWNERCMEEDMDDYIYYNDEYFFEEYFINNVNEAVRAICYGDYRYMEEYVTFNGYGNLETFDKYFLRDHVYMYDLASYLEDTGSLKNEYYDYMEKEDS